MNFCREEEHYYIDGDSESLIQFGTKEYPFKSPIYPTRELYNVRKGGEKIFYNLKAGSSVVLNNWKEHLVFLEIRNLTFQAYDTSESD